MSGFADAERLAAVAGEALRTRGFDLAVAESCTGGLLAGALTAIPGSSDYVKGGIVSYANEVKEQLVGVASSLIQQHGAVSEPVARAMAEGVRDRMRAAVGIGVTGIAGPGGGSAEKPVGLVYVAVATPGGTRIRRDVWPGSRAEVREAGVRAALELLVESLAGA